MIIWQPGQKINKDRFIIQGKPLGSGGFGITYKALEPNTGKLYAIKTLNSTMQIREDFAEQQVKFINEALTIKGFDHPHILKVYEVIQAGELFGVVMEYIDGVTLFQYIQNTGQLSESEALLYIDQIGKALEYVHTKEQLHRDIKPQNILLRQNKQEAVLIDFGLTRSIATKSMTNSYTEGYAPIEQYRRKGSFGSHTDVYALAATLYYLLTADGLKKEEEFHPVPATNRKYDDEVLPEPKHYNFGISQRVNDAILAGMEIEPEKRTPTVLKFRENLGLITPPPPTGFTENLGNGVTLEMVAIPGGKFLMGSPEGEGYDDESPQHEVTVSRFYMGKYPVTQAQWERVAVLPKVKIDLNPKPSYFKGKNLPVETVSWLDAQEFCGRLSKATGKIYRLPSESEWEYACRAGTTTKYYFGDTITTDLANYYDGKYGQTTDVGKFYPNQLGLYDMHGNVWEWCEDSWQENYNNAPKDGSALISQNENKLLRGGSWNDLARHCRSADRFRGSRDGRYNFYGFRVVFCSRT